MTSFDPIASPEKLEAAYHELIPISGYMGIRVKSWADGRLVLSVPLAPNINHQGSGFGGSLFSVAALAGWGILHYLARRWDTAHPIHLRLGLAAAGPSAAGGAGR
ncbi:MAG: YiiD C-terminal domain-containing protein [Gammaproteobacteria bacterium]|nr:YiiD C-terminal domain-containing protein [Gammaproteobacteria bacterium]